MKITIDQEKCIGCGSCTAVCPDVFEMDENNKAQVKKEKEEATDECTQEAVDICPVQAIEIEK
jgi:ferredoxin